MEHATLPNTDLTANPMAKVIVKVRVESPERFIEVVEEQAPERRSHGEINASYFVAYVDSNTCYCIFEWNSTDAAHAFWASAAGKRHIADWRAEGKVDVTVLVDGLAGSRTAKISSRLEMPPPVVEPYV